MTFPGSQMDSRGGRVSALIRTIALAASDGQRRYLVQAEPGGEARVTTRRPRPGSWWACEVCMPDGRVWSIGEEPI